MSSLCIHVFTKKKKHAKNAYTDAIQKTNQTVNKFHNVNGFDIQKLDHSVMVKNFAGADQTF